MLGKDLGGGKKTTKLERLLRQDHSDVYFTNEKLNDELNSRIDGMAKEMHRHDIQRGMEIKKLKEEVYQAKLYQISTGRDDQEDCPAVRPHTAAGHPVRPKTTGTKKTRKRAQSAWARTGSFDSQVRDQSPPQRCESPASSASTLRNTVTLKRYMNVDTSCFKENNRFPEDWYVRCLPASDSAIYNARKKKRGKSAPSSLGFLGKIREREKTEKMLEQYTKMNPKLRVTSDKQDSLSVESGKERLSLICEEPVKPILMSRRRLKEISNVDTHVERGPSRNTERHMSILSLNRIENTRIYNKVRDFCKEIEDIKLGEIRAIKEREEARKREAQEREYAKAVEALKAKEQKELTEETNSNDKLT